METQISDLKKTVMMAIANVKSNRTQRASKLLKKIRESEIEEAILANNFGIEAANLLYDVENATNAFIAKDYDADIVVDIDYELFPVEISLSDKGKVFYKTQLDSIESIMRRYGVPKDSDDFWMIIAIFIKSPQYFSIGIAMRDYHDLITATNRKAPSKSYV